MGNQPVKGDVTNVGKFTCQFHNLKELISGEKDILPELRAFITNVESRLEHLAYYKMYQESKGHKDSIQYYDNVYEMFATKEGTIAIVERNITIKKHKSQIKYSHCRIAKWNLLKSNKDFIKIVEKNVSSYWGYLDSKSSMVSLIYQINERLGIPVSSIVD